MFVLDGPSFFCVPQHSQGGRENLPAGKKMSPIIFGTRHDAEDARKLGDHDTASSAGAGGQ